MGEILFNKSHCLVKNGEIWYTHIWVQISCICIINQNELLGFWSFKISEKNIFKIKLSLKFSFSDLKKDPPKIKEFILCQLLTVTVRQDPNWDQVIYLYSFFEGVQIKKQKTIMNLVPNYSRLWNRRRPSAIDSESIKPLSVLHSGLNVSGSLPI